MLVYTSILFHFVYTRVLWIEYGSPQNVLRDLEVKLINIFRIKFVVFGIWQLVLLHLVTNISRNTFKHVQASWNVMAHAQKPDFVFRRNGRVHLKSAGASVQSTTGSRGVRISCSNAGYIMFRGSVSGTGYPLHSPVSPSLPNPVRHRVPSHFNWNLPLRRQ